MATYKITINMDNEAFNPPETEIARILRTLADNLVANRDSLIPLLYCNLRDSNGNTVGTAEVME